MMSVFIWIALGAAVLLLYLGVLGLAVMGICFLRSPRYDTNYDPAQDEAAFQASGSSSYRQNAREGNIWWNKQVLERQEIISFDGLRLVGHLLRAPNPGNRVALVVHGHHCVSGELGFISRMFHNMGCHVLAPDQRTHGKSEGKYLGMGALEWRDMARWIARINEIFAEGCEIVLYGNSMGAATVMMLAGQAGLADNVVCAVEDCGYASAWDVVYGELAKQMAVLPLKRGVMASANLWLRLLAHCSTRDVDCAASLRRAALPMLFIHGTADATVPFSDMAAVSAAHLGESETLVMEGAEHGVCYFQDEALYTDTVRAFADRYCRTPAGTPS